MKNTILIIILLSLYSCTTERKATQYFNNHLEKLAPLCAENFPVKDSLVVKDSVRFDTLFMEGEPVVLKDSFYIKGDTVVKQVTKECPKVQTIIKTVTRDSIHYVRDKAYEKVIEGMYLVQLDRAQKLQQTVGQLQDKIKHKNKVIWWLIIVVAIQSIWIFRRPLLSLINPIKAIPI